MRAHGRAFVTLLRSPTGAWHGHKAVGLGATASRIDRQMPSKAIAATRWRATAYQLTIQALGSARKRSEDTLSPGNNAASWLRLSS